MGVGRFFVFFLVLAALHVLASYYVARKLTRQFGLHRRVEKTALATVVAAIVAMGIARATELRPLGQAAFAILLALIITTGLLLIVDLIKLPLRLALYIGNRNRPAPVSAPATPELALAPAVPAETQDAVGAAREAQIIAPSAPVASPRRVFLGQAVTGSAMVLGTSTSFYGALFGRQDYMLEEVPIRIAGMSRRLDGYTLVQLSDIHFGVYVGEPEIRAAEELVRKARPDRIVLTGDLVDNDPRHAEMLGRLVRRLGPLARDGVVAIAGNHDWYAGVDVTMGAAQAGGARILRNDGLVIGSEKEGIALLGVEDVWARRIDPNQGPNLEKALSRVPADLPRILLCHNPVYFPEAAGKVALQLSGHTHGGQVNLGPIKPADLVLPYGYVRGRYERDGSQLYINRGFGTAGPPARIGSPPEVTRIVLVSA